MGMGHDFSVLKQSLFQSQSDLMAASYNTAVDGRSSVMSDHGTTHGAQVTLEDGQGRRMSDPVRPLDRNFGVGGQMSRHRSYGNLQQGGGQRQPLHQQRVRGQDGAYCDQGYMPQVS